MLPLDRERWKVISGATRIAIAVVSGILVLYAIRGGLIFHDLSENSYTLFIAFAAAGFIEKLIPNLMHNVGNGPGENNGEAAVVKVAREAKTDEKPLTRDLILLELKKRLKDDNLQVTKDWDSSIWLNEPLVGFCNGDEEEARNVLCDVINKMLLSSGKRLTGAAEHELRKSVNSQIDCKSAIDMMVKAKNNVEPKRAV